MILQSLTAFAILCTRNSQLTFSDQVRASGSGGGLDVGRGRAAHAAAQGTIHK